MRGRRDDLKASKGMSTALKLLLVVVTLLIVMVIVLSIFNVRVESANDMLSKLAADAFGNLSQALSSPGS